MPSILRIFLSQIVYDNNAPQIPRPITKYKPAKIKITLEAVEYFFLIAKPNTINKMGGTSIIAIKNAINPPKFPISCKIISFLIFLNIQFYHPDKTNS